MTKLQSTCCWLLAAALLLPLVHGMEDFVFSDTTRIDKLPLTSSKTPSARQNSVRARQLADEDDNYESYLVDRNGNAYEPYSLAWRYLGMYIDCDLDAQRDNEGRFLEGDDDCQRTVLWAAYVDPRYKGGTIGEYQFYDIQADTWDTSTCQTRRCSKMDCHEPNSHFKLVGVFKETNGLYDWAEQLFKHEGYCVWNDDDTYEFMTGRLETWPSQCTQLYLPDSNGDTLYYHTLPLGEGNLTMGIFADSSCTQVSNTTTFYDYVIMYYSNYYYGSDYGTQQAETWQGYIEQWNEAMSTWKVCQPCRAYSISQNSDNDNHNDGRFLENNDGEGDEEQWGYNCYDDAGYTNVNQCYKFEVKTDLFVADASDLARASKQGSILRIKFKGKVYGSGGYGSSFDYSSPWMVTLVLGLGMLIGGAIAFIIVRRRCFTRDVKGLAPSFREHFHIESKETIDSLGQSESDEVRGNRLLFTVLYKLFARNVCSPNSAAAACSPTSCSPPPTLCGNIQYADDQEGDVDEINDREDIRPID